MSAIASATTPGTQQAQPIQHRKKPRSAIILSGTAWIVGILFVLPVLWMVLTSFHSEPDAAKNPRHCSPHCRWRGTRPSSTRVPGRRC